MHLQTADSIGPTPAPDELEKAFVSKSSALPFGQDVALSSLSGPTYVTAQTLVQQVAYALSDKLFTYSPATFDLDVAALGWNKASERNAYGEVSSVHALETRTGAGAMALGYMFSPDFDMKKRHVPQSVLASAGSLEYLRGTLDELATLYDVASPTNLQVAAVEYVPETGLVSDYTSALALADDLGMGLVASKSQYEAQHMSLLSVLLSNVLPTAHTYDGISVGRETTRVIDVLNVDGLKRTYESVLGSVKADLGSKRLTNEGKVVKLMEAFNAELGTEYKPIEYSGHKEATSIVVVFGTIEASLSAQVAEALAAQGLKIGVVNVRLYRPFLEEDFLAALPPTVQQIAVLGQVKDQASVADNNLSSSLYADVLAAVNFQSMTTGEDEPNVYDIKYARETVWNVTKMENLLRQLGTRPGEARQESVHVTLTSKETKQYTFWDVDSSASVETPIMLGQLLADDSALNVTLRSANDNLVQGGIVRIDLRCSAKSIEAPYSVKEANVIVVGEEKLLEGFNVVESVQNEGALILKIPGWKDEDLEKKLSAPLRKTIAQKNVKLYVLDPTASEKVIEDESLETYLLQLAFLKIARPDLYEQGLQKLTGSETLELLAKDLETAFTAVEVPKTFFTLSMPENWFAVESKEPEALPPAGDLNVNAFGTFKNVGEEPPSLLRTWSAVAKGLAFKEAYGTATALRPDLGVKTAIVHVKEHRRLTPETYDRNIFHIEFDLGDSGLTYDIGEALGIHAENDKHEVEKFIKWYGLNADEVVEVQSRDDRAVLENRTVYQALMQNVDIFGRPPKRFYEALSEFTSDEKEKNELLVLGTGGNQEAVIEFKRRAETDTITFADILLEFPSAHPSFHDIVRIVNPMKRREYSVASSQKVTPNSISLLIVTVEWVDPKGRDRFGQATRYLNDLPVGAPVTVSIKPSVMKLPPKTTQPIIMAGLGTGLAPFRAFVQERAWQRQQGMPIGDVFLYMGSRHQREEYLYGEEWEAYQDAGIITLLGRAFSRDQPQKIYIQDRMRQTLSEIRRAYLREEGAFYLCGPTWPVPDVTNVLEEAVVEEAAAEGKKKDGAKEIERMKEELRYVLEVY